MSDAGTTGTNTGPGAIGTDLVMAIGIITIILMLIMPMASWLLDLMLTISITFSVLVLMTSIFMERPLQFSSFPTILLVATMLRLSLNLASTRLILSEGHTGSDAAGAVIEAFGNFLMGSNVIIGLIVFSILVIVNFIVITKGSGRIAEVAARFSLDAMPGKQMAIDADLSAGVMDENEARAKRKELENESSFYGSMDGASKFVRGDAVAGLLITFINIVGGIIIGTTSENMSFGNAVDRYTALTIGDGLVTQIPALIVSISAGMLVTKAGVSGSTDKALFAQLSFHPQAMLVSAGLLLLLGVLPGLPFLPFFIIGGILAFMGVQLGNQKEEKERELLIAETTPDEEDTAPVEEPITAALAIDQIRLELGYGLLTLINDESGYRLTDQIKALRRQLASDRGFVMPSVRILDNMQLPGNTYSIRIKETEIGRGDVRPGMLLVMDPKGEEVTLAGEPTTEPAFGLPAMWVDQTLREEASFRGFTVVDAATVITTHLTEAIKDNMAELLSYAETQKLLDDLPENQQKLISDLVPNIISVSGIQRVLQNLLAEGISVRDLPTILEGISEGAGYSQNIVTITEHVRGRLARQISSANTSAEGYIPLLTLSPEWEQAFQESLVGQGEDKQLAMAPSKLQEFITSVRMSFDQQAQIGQVPVLLTSPNIRPYVRSIIERIRSATIVMSQNEIHPKAKIKTLGQV